jgi:hypothetical protein
MSCCPVEPSLSSPKAITKDNQRKVGQYTFELWIFPLTT